MLTIQLMTTAGCHLCEQAHAMFQYLVANDENIKQNFDLQLIDIIDKDELVDEYGIRIPVFIRAYNGKRSELGWPFELHQLSEWLSGDLSV
ncbi:glutaredoxin family protein [Aliikangiella maris]|uniref:Glutaredoxin family protein n=2 Tax=Aliikangiella maris TaxID=3162458 RepID=A0ABV2BVI0_9GAMM